MFKDYENEAIRRHTVQGTSCNYCEENQLELVEQEDLEEIEDKHEGCFTLTDHTNILGQDYCKTYQDFFGDNTAKETPKGNKKELFAYIILVIPLLILDIFKLIGRKLRNTDEFLKELPSQARTYQDRRKLKKYLSKNKNKTLRNKFRGK